MSLEGVTEFKRNLKTLRRDLIEGTKRGIHQATLDALQDAEPTVPIDEGDLRKSKYSDPPQVNGSTVENTFGYDVPYALPVHERMDVYHKPPTRAKFMEITLNANRDKYEAIVNKFVNEALGS